MTERQFYIVDVFAESKYAGNQLAVVRNAAGLSTEEMQTIAKEMNYSETTFVLSDEENNGGYDVRIFTVNEELPYAGHPTLGTAYIIQREIVGVAFDNITLNLKIGPIPVTFTYRDGLPDVLWMRPQPPTFGKKAAPAKIARSLGLTAADVDERFPIQVVSTGVPFLIVPLKTLDAVRRARPHPEKYKAAVEQAGAHWMFIFCPQPYDSDNHLNARMFAVEPNGTVWEDPATGSANGCLAAYLSHHRYFGSESINVRVEQGYEIGRPSLLLLRSERQEDDEGIRVAIGGRVFMVASGVLH